MKSPSVSTIKRLFVLSKNQCAFTGCSEPLIDPVTDSLVARVCHIKGNRPGSARYDEHQTDEERHGFANLVLMCPKHSDIIDDKKNLEQFTTENLTRMKSLHEAEIAAEEPSDELQEKFAVEVLYMLHNEVRSINQTGGQTANVIYNIHGKSSKEDTKSFLEGRNVIDTTREDFAVTKYSTSVGFLRPGDSLIAPPVFAMLFGKLHQNQADSFEEDSLLAWTQSNSLRYAPVDTYPFVPTAFTERRSSGILWHDARSIHPNDSFRYCRYLAIEYQGYIEYGFCPCYPWDQNGHGVYYAKCVANAFAFVSLVGDLVSAFRDNGDATIGIAVRCNGDYRLRGIRESIRAQRTVSGPAVERCLSFTTDSKGRPAPDEVSRKIGQAILENWSHSTPVWEELPEFKGGKYSGEFFRENFNSEYCWG